MCLIVFSYEPSARYPLILLANRDEFYSRPTESARFWDDAPTVFGGRDLVHGGTWLGITRAGRFAALTNYRQAGGNRGTVSRGRLVSDFLARETTIETYFREIEERAEDFSGFNLIAGDFGGAEPDFRYISNRGGGIVRAIAPGIHGLSNHLLDTNWPKVVRAKTGLEKLIADADLPDRDDLFGLGRDRTPAADTDLPETGIGIERERLLSPVFIETPVYGTRSTSVVIFDRERGLALDERVYI